MALPEIRVEIGFTSPYVGSFFVIGDPARGRVGVDPIGAESIWTTIPNSCVRSWSVRRGCTQANAPTRRYEPSTVTIVFNDGDRRFDPDNLLGPYVSAGVSQITPMRRVRITAIWAGVAYPIVTAYADDWVPEYVGGFWTYTTLTATDASKIFADDDRPAVPAVGAGEFTGARVNRILDSISWPAAERLISTGDSSVQATELSGGALQELQVVQDTELGDFFVNASGVAVFQDRSYVTSNAASRDSQATFGDGGWVRPIDYGFSAGVADWAGVSCSVAQSTAFAYPNAHSLLMTVTGSPTQAYARSLYMAPAEEGRSYTATMWVYRPVAGNVTAAIDYFDAVGAYLGGAYSTTAVAAATWTQLTVSGVTDPGTAGLLIGPTLAGSPPTGTQLYLNATRVEVTTQELPYADVKLTGVDDTLVNRVRATRVGGTEQIASDVTSQVAYLIKTHERSDLIHQTDSDALGWAQALLYTFKDPVRRFARLEFNTPSPEVDDAMWPQVLGREFGDRITVIRRPAGGGDPIEHDAFVRGVEHASDGASWTSAFVLQAADRYSYFTIGHPTLGRVGVNPIGF